MVKNSITINNVLGLCACLGVFYYNQSVYSYIPWIMKTNYGKRVAFLLKTKTIIRASSSSSSDPHPPNTPPPEDILKNENAYFASADNQIDNSNETDNGDDPDESVSSKDDASDMEKTFQSMHSQLTEVRESITFNGEDLLEWGNMAIENVLKPMTDIQKGVPSERIKGAALTGAALGFVAGNSIIASGAIGLSAAYLAISKGVAGDVFRTVGGIAWDVTDTTARLANILVFNEKFNVLTKDLTEKAISAFQDAQKSAQKLEDRRATAEIDDAELEEAEQDFLNSREDLTKALEEAEAIIDQAGDTISQAEQSMKEKVEDMREKVGDMQSDDEEDNYDDGLDVEDFLAAVELSQEGLEGKIVGLEDVIADTNAKAEWDAAGTRARELGQDDSDDDDITDDDDFEGIDLVALGRAAREAVESFENKMNEQEEEKAEQRENWAASMSSSSAEDETVSGTIDWLSFTVAQLKSELKSRGLKATGKKTELVALLEQDDAEKAIQDDEDVDVGYTQEAKHEFEDFDVEELGRQAREAVQMFQSGKGNFDEEPTQEMLAELENEMAINGDLREQSEFSEMTVAQLKEECRTRGLKVGGKKAELIERLHSADG